MSVGIYKITSPSGKVYIGQSWDIKRRWYNHKCAAWDKQRKLYASFKKYGVENHIFEIVHELPTDVEQEVLDRYEIFYIEQYKECGIEMLNLRDGGNGGKMSYESKQRLIKSLKGNKNGSSNKGSKRSEEVKTKMGQKAKERMSVEYLKNWHRNNTTKEYLQKNKQHLDRVRNLAISVLKTMDKSYQRTEEYREMMSGVLRNSDALKQGMKNRSKESFQGRSKPVLQYDRLENFIAEYPSSKDASIGIGVKDYTAINKCCNETRRTAYNYIWKFKN